MAKRDQLLRLMNVVNYLRGNTEGASFDEIQKYLEEKSHKDSEGELAFVRKLFREIGKSWKNC